MSTTVFEKKRPLMPYRPARARRLLRAGRARVAGLYPFTIRLVDRTRGVVPRAAGGSDRVSNLVTACISCNQKKGAKPVEAFLKDKPEVPARVKRQIKTPLRDAAAVNATRRAHQRRAHPEEPRHPSGAVHRAWIPAANASLTKFGFPRGCLMRQKRVHGFATGDMEEAVVPCGKKAGFWPGRAAVRASGSFNIQTPKGVVQGVSWKYCRLISLNDGYGYAWLRPAPHSSPA